MNKQNILKTGLNFGLIMILIGTIIFMSGCIGGTTDTDTKPTGEENETSNMLNGTVVFAVTDAAADMGAVSSVKLTINAVEVHRVAEEGWITISTEEKTYDLLELKAQGATELLAKVNLTNGVYNRIRLNVKNAVVVMNGVETEAKLPGNELKIDADIEVKGGEITTALLDFIVDESLHITGNGKIIMSPVVKVETKTNAKVEIKDKEQNRVEITGGEVKTRITIGMNEKGESGVGLKIKGDVGLIIDDKGKVKVLSITSTQALKLAENLNITLGNKAEIKGNSWVISGIDAETNETLEIKVDALTGLITKTNVKAKAGDDEDDDDQTENDTAEDKDTNEEYGENTECNAECKSNCKGNISANCITECSAEGEVSCIAKADANCNAQCTASLTASCKAECKSTTNLLECETRCAANLGGQTNAECQSNCKSELINVCEAKCVASARAECILECKTRVEAECKANAEAACNAQCKADVSFNNCYSECMTMCEESDVPR
ncbi:MAG: hypothetical protein CVT90_00865 [Candidatus Altiarchaeales archaeon HGW-Altiarchaeales-3]|nr:MAG: hypothetical protein CVT90_00865 [Candidatus Altiarchaeales archaeon HGW-Altiarchaeales-3]